MNKYIYILLLIPSFCFAQIERHRVVKKTNPTNLKTPFDFVPPQFEVLSCFQGDNEDFSEPVPAPISTDISSSCITIYVETDYYTYQKHGSVEATENWVNALFAEVAHLYTHKGINIKLSEINVPTSPSWADSIGNARDILYRFGAHADDSVNGRLKHFVTMRSLGGGIAFVGVLCAQRFFLGSGLYGGPYAVSGSLSKTVTPYPNYSWSTMVIAHEMGHNIGSPHTHACSWRLGNQSIDDCYPSCELVPDPQYSTVMSYCHLTTHGIDFNVGFGNEPGDLLVDIILGSPCAIQPEERMLTGFVDGEFSAQKIILEDVTQAGDLTIRANEIELLPESVFMPIFTVNPLVCQ